ncbi:hypothetical protein SNEBB_010683 [Seison nebaliae]|nr:hypothetical protein SNEBB_010683 [Seison nebaliae]
MSSKIQNKNEDGTKKDLKKKIIPYKLPSKIHFQRRPDAPYKVAHNKLIQKKKTLERKKMVEEHGDEKKLKLSLAKMKKGQHLKRKKKIRTNAHFYRPHTKRLQRDPQYIKKISHSKRVLDLHGVIKMPLATECVMKKIEEHNTLAFIVNLKANKHLIKKAFFKMYGEHVKSVNTLITPLGQKKAFIRLPKDRDALELANKIGLV